MAPGWPVPAWRAPRPAPDLFWTNTPTAYVDISRTIDRKLDALRAHASQLKDFDRVEEWVRHWTAEQGAQVGVAAADGFHLVIIDEKTTRLRIEETEAARPARSA
jgi:LmbE family N-acetylglucosaminyl deacetylase